jgi:hypothetical protein
LAEALQLQLELVELERLLQVIQVRLVIILCVQQLHQLLVVAAVVAAQPLAAVAERVAVVAMAAVVELVLLIKVMLVETQPIAHQAAAVVVERQR